MALLATDIKKKRERINKLECPRIKSTEKISWYTRLLKNITGQFINIEIQFFKLIYFILTVKLKLNTRHSHKLDSTIKSQYCFKFPFIH